MSLRNQIFSLIVLILSLLSCTVRIKQIVQRVEKNIPKNLSTDSILHRLQRENNLVIGYSAYNYTWSNVPISYYLIAINNKYTKSYKYIIKSRIIRRFPCSHIAVI